MESKEAVAFLLAPVHRCVEFLAEEMKVGGTIKHALILTSSARRLVRFGHSWRAVNGECRERVRRF